MIALLIATGCLLPPLVLGLASHYVSGFDYGTWYRPGTVSKLPVVTLTLVEQLVICIVSFGLKPAYTLISLVLIVRLWHTTLARFCSCLSWQLHRFLCRDCTVQRN